MSEWRAQIAGDNVEALLNISGARDWIIVKEGTDYFLTSSQFAPDEEAAEVKTLADQLLEQIELAAFVQSDTRHNLHTVKLVRIDDDGARQGYLFGATLAAAEAHMSADAQVVSPDGKIVPPAPPAPSPIISTTSLIGRRADVAEALRLYYSKHDDWTQLCVIIEMVRHAINGEIPSAWASGNKVKLLKQTAQFRSTAGNTARHLWKSGTPPEKPMPLAEAQELVWRVLQRWIESVAT